MAAKRNDLTGKIFGKLTVLGYSHSNRYAYWKCRCECGKETIVRSSHLVSGAIKTCGCSWQENGKNAHEANLSHGGCRSGRSRLYIIWCNIIQRCENQNSTGYRYYGGRGIKIFSEWHDFKVFRDWATKNGYNDKLTIDRIDVNGNYEPSNCRWATMEVQANNKRKNVNLTYKGITKTAVQWAREYDIPISTFFRWLNEGESIEDIFQKRCGKHRMIQHICTVCGSLFESHSHKSIYCSDECKRIGENKAQQLRRLRKRAA